MIRTYLDWMVELPWSVSSEEQIDLPRARAILDADHYDLEKVKSASLSFSPFASSSLRAKVRSCASSARRA